MSGTALSAEYVISYIEIEDTIYTYWCGMADAE